MIYTIYDKANQSPWRVYHYGHCLGNIVGYRSLPPVDASSVSSVGVTIFEGGCSEIFTDE